MQSPCRVCLFWGAHSGMTILGCLLLQSPCRGVRDRVPILGCQFWGASCWGGPCPSAHIGVLISGCLCCLYGDVHGGVSLLECPYPGAPYRGGARFRMPLLGFPMPGCPVLGCRCWGVRVAPAQIRSACPCLSPPGGAGGPGEPGGHGGTRRGGGHAWGTREQGEPHLWRGGRWIPRVWVIGELWLDGGDEWGSQFW